MSIAFSKFSREETEISEKCAFSSPEREKETKLKAREAHGSEEGRD